jgi:hypothetical protein
MSVSGKTPNWRDDVVPQKLRQQELMSELLGSTDCEALLDIKDPDQTVTNIVEQINFLKDRLVGPRFPHRGRR